MKPETRDFVNSILAKAEPLKPLLSNDVIYEHGSEKEGESATVHYRLGMMQARKFYEAKGAEGFLDSMTPDQRTDVFSKYCTHCGAKDPKCQCWNDE